MTPYERLVHQLVVLQKSIELDWQTFEDGQLTPTEVVRVRELVRATRESMAQLSARLDDRYGKSG
jgi:hypothetical protein